MTTTIETIHLPLIGGGEVQIERIEGVAVEPESVPVALDTDWELSPSELGIVTQRAIQALQEEVCEDSAAGIAAVEKLEEVSNRIEVVRAEQMFLLTEEGLVLLEDIYCTSSEEVVDPEDTSVKPLQEAESPIQLDETKVEQTGAMMSLAELDEEDMPSIPDELVARQIAVLKELDAMQDFADEIPVRVEEERRIIERIKRQPTMLDAQESGFALAALHNELGAAMDAGDFGRQVEALGAISWVLGNTLVTEIHIDDSAYQVLHELSQSSATPALVS